MVRQHGAMSAYPRFAGGQSLVYGKVSEEVARVAVRIGDGDAQQAALVPAPEGTPAGLRLFRGPRARVR